jgi:hypothetical protein
MIDLLDRSALPKLFCKATSLKKRKKKKKKKQKIVREKTLSVCSGLCYLHLFIIFIKIHP